MNGFNFEKCNGCPYYFGEDDVPDNLEKKCKKGDRKSKN